MFELTILGCHSATPTENKHTSSQILDLNGNLFLIDCGEGTQMQLRKAKVRFTRIKHIFISHLHGDHFFGLIGLISTFRLLGRSTPLNIYGPKGIKEIITLQLKMSNSWTDYALNFHELSSLKSELIYEDDSISVSTLPLDHRIYTNGFLFTSKTNKRKINSHATKGLDLEPFHYSQLQEGCDIELADGTFFENQELTLDSVTEKKYAYCSDTAYNEDLILLLKGVDLLYHEATFLERHADLAKKTKHSTALQAAKIAAAADVKALLLGHFSSRYSEKLDFLKEASKVFETIFLSEDLKTFSI
jgi:ribonuclease Z